ncbi:glycosyltransferase [Sphaerisporangium sp. B11E5]|uniref:glycosyltransferase n=1 Tax=Sphaerisporangium sp. B11E5 TaxID=3153563 RepID=UPI00325F2B35
MRVLFVSLSSAGHTYPLVPLAVAARDAGHEVRFAVGEGMHPALEGLGVRPFRVADSFYEVYAEDMEPELRRWRPDLVVHGWGVPGAAVAAVRAGVPGLWHGFGRMFPDGIGLEPPARNAETRGRPHIDICPASLQDKEFLETEERVPLRPVPFSGTHGPKGWDVSPGPVVYVTLGTAFGTPELLRMLIDGLAVTAARVVVAAGRVAVEEVGAVPGNVTVRTWVDQAELWPHVDVVVHHGGSGTTLGALGAGVPQVMLPQGADQFANAEAVAAAGAGLRLLPGEVTAGAVAGCVAEARHGGYRDAARAIAEEIARMPSPREVARRLPEFV